MRPNLKMTMFCYPLLGALLLLFSAGEIGAKPEHVPEEKTITFALSEAPPRRIYGPLGEVSGFDVNILRYLAKKMSMQIAFKPCPLARCLHMMKKGEADVMPGLRATPDRKKYMHFLRPQFPFTTIKAFYLRADDQRRIRQYSDLQKLTIGVERGVKYFERFDTDNKLQKYEVADKETLVKMLVKKRIDAMIGIDYVVDYTLHQMQVADRVVKAQFEHAQDIQAYYAALAKSSPLASAKQEFEKTLREMFDKGVIEKLKQDFLKDFPIQRQPSS